MSKYLRAKREQGMMPEDAVRYAFRTVGQALLITTMILVIGFGILGDVNILFQRRDGADDSNDYSSCVCRRISPAPTIITKNRG